MKFRTILTLIAAALVGSAHAQGRTASPGDDTVLEMAQAYRQGNKARLAQLLPQARGHLLEPWAAYWELRARLDTASPQEVKDFFVRYAGTYQEDRLRNDWLLLLGQRRDWTNFADEHPRFRMNDDTQVKCYGLLVQQLREGPSQALADEAKRLWYAQRDAEDACTTAVRNMADASANGKATGLVSANDIWRRARLAAEFNKPAAALAAVEIVSPESMSLARDLLANPAKFLKGSHVAFSRTRKQLVAVALARLAATDHEAAAERIDDKWSLFLTTEERNWLWGVVGRQAAMKLSPDALAHFAKVTRDSDLTDEMLGWKARAALRAGTMPQWRVVLDAIAAMGPAMQQDPTWVYWRARGLLAVGANDAERAEGRRLLASIASPRGFYEQLAQEDLGQRIAPPPRPVAPSAEEREWVRRLPGTQRALHAIAIGLRSEGVREWNYTTNLAHPGGMNDRELLAAAQLACEREVWDRCINTSERTKGEFDVEQRFPMPLRDSVLRRSREIGLDPSYVYGLIRQESRFVTDARSWVGASGLMQVMPATARWTARKLGMAGFTPDQLAERETNIAIGTGYLKLVLDDFSGSMPMAAAAYNAGPGRPRNWRNGPVLEGAIWAENVPFHETRDYVKKVLSNATMYAAIISGQPQSLRARLGTVGPRDPNVPEPNKDLP